MDEKIVLCACSGMNPRGEVSRVSVYDLSVEHADIEYCCVVASGGNFKKFIDLAQNHKVIAVNGCENCCPETILKTKDASVEYNLNVKQLLEEHDLKAECTVRINENDEKCVNVIKNEILKIKKEI
ncbi:MAG: putative zinc-binding protein [Methanobrevibacter sp.]|uniref:putative zinc-binding protein n=1 Tax=Methanobrevibacter sp. TaxID=66852 RepID=UPI002E7702C3|nr:putative zinc-binding protein [Methanobrevibacter sp.]MEE0901815.1 putative zinc-binding protein [Methanobrevibacter sp.]MEE0936286.1 putative zinc-binding protein [Methanobrevibacter sp.]